MILNGVGASGTGLQRLCRTSRSSAIFVAMAPHHNSASIRRNRTRTICVATPIAVGQGLPQPKRPLNWGKIPVLHDDTINYRLRDAPRGPPISQIMVQTLPASSGGRRTVRPILHNQTVADLKVEMQAHWGWPECKTMDLLYLGDDGNNVAMEDDMRLLEDYQVEDRTHLWARVRLCDFQVQLGDGKSVTVQSLACDTVANVKDKLERFHKIPAEEQHLFKDSKELEDAGTLSSYGIIAGKVTTLKLQVGTNLSATEVLEVADSDIPQTEASPTKGSPKSRLGWRWPPTRSLLNFVFNAR